MTRVDRGNDMRTRGTRALGFMLFAIVLIALAASAPAKDYYFPEVRLDITVTEAGSPVEESTWSSLKRFFGF